MSHCTLIILIGLEGIIYNYYSLIGLERIIYNYYSSFFPYTQILDFALARCIYKGMTLCLKYEQITKYYIYCSYLYTFCI